MQILISEVRAALQLRLYMVGVIGLFAIPDAAATVEYGSIPPRKRYPLWFDTFVGDDAKIDGQLAWMARNALIHESAMNWRAGGYDVERLIIGLPKAGAATFHGIEIAHRDPETLITSAASMVVELQPLADAIITGALSWLDTISDQPEKNARLAGMMQVRPQGFARFIEGKALIT